MNKSTFFLGIFFLTSVTFCKADNSSINDSLFLALQNDSIAEYYKAIDQLDSAILYKNEASIIYSHIYNESDTLYTDCLYELACLNYDAQHFKSAITLFEKIERLQEKYKIYDVEGHSLIIAHLSLSYAHMEYYPQAIKTCKMLLELKEKNESSVDFSYEEILGYLSNYYSADGNVHKALECSLKAYDIIEKDSTIDDGVRITTLDDIAGCFFQLNDIESAIKYQEKAISLSIELCQKNQETGSAFYTRSLYNMSRIYYNTLNFQESMRIINRCVNYCRDNGMENDLTYAHSLLLLANINHDTDYKKRAVQLCRDSYEAHKSILGENNEYTLRTQLVLSEYSAWAGEYNDAIAVGEEAIRKYGIIYDENSLHYASALARFAAVYAAMGNMEKGIDMLSRSIDIYGNKSLTNTSMMISLARYCASTNNYKKAIAICKTAIEKGPISQLDECLINADMAYYYYKLSDITNAKKHIVIYVNFIKSSLFNKLAELPYASKNDYWDYVGSKMRDLIPLIAYETQDQDLINIAYNYSALFSKGLLYRADYEFRNAVYMTNNHDVISKYLELNSNKNELFHILTTSIHKERLDSLIDIIQEQEMQIIKEIGYKIPQVSSWEDIHNQLAPNEMAIEFVAIPFGNEKQYIALILKKDFNAPKCYGLFLEKGTNNLKDEFHNFLTVIKTDLEGVDSIYFSPIGIINNVAIEYMPIDMVTNLSDKYNVYRLSTTEMLINRGKRKPEWQNAVLYGDLTYDTTAYPEDNNHQYSFSFNRSMRDFLTTRTGFEPLYYSGEEIDDIYRTLVKGHLKTKLYKRDVGTEKSFKLLSGENVNLLHIATHGMYVGENIEEEKTCNNFRFIQNDDVQYNIFREDQQMTRSFLVMSGGNKLPRRILIEEGDDDILTAQEISLLHFQNLDMVTLSACQSALGDITFDGVLGLQRAFKKAGANTILMSLDKVDDKATKILMTDFYKNLMLGKSKHQSLKDAQRHLREVENGKYDKPEYWAAFIMLDGLN